MSRRGTIFLVFCVAIVGQVANSYGQYDYDYNWSPETQEWSTPEECARQCVDGESPRVCYYHFTVELYATMGVSCNICTPSVTNQLSSIPQCQCITGDGFEKTVLSINRMIPGPSIQACKNDYIVVDVRNEAEGVEATLHWHGDWKQRAQYYDGVPHLTQCPIGSGNTFRYQFPLLNSGTHFYHSHISVYMIDGQYGSMIVRDPPSSNPHYRLYDFDDPKHIMLISDWMHELSLERYPGRYRNDPGQRPASILINGKGTWTDPATNKTTNVPLEKFTVRRGGRYRFRFINSFSSVCLSTLSIENHPLTIIAMDGENIQPVTVNEIISATGERVDFIIHANQSDKNYWIHVKGLGECGEQGLYQLALLEYKGANPNDMSSRPSYNGFSVSSSVMLNPLNATRCSSLTPIRGQYCYNQLKSTGWEDWSMMRVNPDQRIVLPFQFFSFNRSLTTTLFSPGSEQRFYVGPNRDHVISEVRNISFQNPEAPPISQREGYEYICPSKSELSQCTQPCLCTNVYHIRRGDLVELVVYDSDPFLPLSHPFHLHGYAFTVFDIGQFGLNITVKDIDLAIQRHVNRLKRGEYSLQGKKDTLVIPMGGYAIIRFKADNPGWWLFHCHFTWHTVSGMDIVFHVGQPSDLPPIPRDFPKCYSFTPPINK